MPGDKTFDALLRTRQSDRGWRSSALLLAIISFCVLSVLWAANTEIDDVSRADGRIVPSSSLVLVQAPESGTVDHVLVDEGDIVEAGQLLMEMDDTRFSGHLDQERQQAFALRARLARLRSEVDGGMLNFTPELELQAPLVVASERELFAARAAQLDAEVDVFSVQLEQQRGALVEAEALQLTARDTERLVNDQIAAIEPLVSSGLEPQTSLLQLQIQLSEWNGRLAQASARVEHERSRLGEIEHRILALRNRFRSDAFGELTQTIGELAGLAPSFPILEQRVRDTEIRSPVAGVVNQVFVSTAGAIVPTGAELVEIVPIEDHLVVEAFVPPADIAFLFVGQSVNVKLTAYDFSRYGALRGQIERIGASPVRHPEHDYSVFAVEVATHTSLFDAADRPLPVVPGMIAEVEFVSEQKSVLDYIIQPVVRVRDTAFRD